MPVSARVVSSVRVEEEARSGRRDWNVFNSCCRGREKGAAEERGGVLRPEPRKAPGRPTARWRVCAQPF